MRSRSVAPLLLLTAAPLLAGDQARPSDPLRARKPRLELRASPRMAFSPVMVLVTAELRGGDDVEEYYCPELEWDWDDGGKSARGHDCPPYEPGMEMERRYSEQHAYRRAGTYNVKITLKRANRTVAAATTTVHVRSGLGDPSEPN